MKTCLLILLVGVLAGCTESNVRQASEKFSNLPAAVRNTVRAKAPNAEIARVNKSERNGQLTYVIEFQDSRLYPDMEVAADGTMVKYEAGAAVFGRAGNDTTKGTGSSGKTDLSALPIEVQKAIDKNAPKADVVDIRRSEHDGKVIYEVEYAGNAPRRVLQVAADGTLVRELQPRSHK